MAWPVYSQQFLLDNASTGYSSFEVPAGFVAVVRDFSIYDTVGGNVTKLMVQDSDAAPGICVAALEATGVAQYSQWQGRVVVPAGGIISLELVTVGDTPDVYVGGYLLAISGTR